MPGEFADSNVLLYLVSSDLDKLAKSERLLQRGLTVSVQVLNEVVNVATRKFGRDWAEVAAFMADLRPLLQVHDLTLAMHAEALWIVQRYQLSWWDALIVAAALEAECDTLYSEDMHHGLVIDGRLTVVNPFA